MKRRRVVSGRVLFTGLAAVLMIGAVASAASRPTDDQIAFAQRVSDLMLNELVAALFTEFDETTPGNVAEGKQAISLIFDDHNRNMRLIGTFAPLLGGRNDLPKGAFEETALTLALQGQSHTSVERDGSQWYYRRSTPLSNTFHPNCVLCHTNFTSEFFEQTNNPGEWVGALVQRIPIPD